MPRANGYTRQEILTAVKRLGNRTAEDLSRELGISPVAVRQHLTALASEGYVAASMERRGLGRPVHRYAITRRGDETFPRAYDQLANATLDELRAWQGDAAVNTLFEKRRERIRFQFAPRMEGKDLAGRVAELARMQNEAGYMAEVRTDGDDVILTERNCAICAVAREYRAACVHELGLFQDLAGPNASVTRRRYILDGDTACEYTFRAGRE